MRFQPLALPAIPAIPAILAALATPLAALELPGLFSDGAILQRDRPVPVWGRAAPEATIRVRFAGQTRETQADADGRWRVELDAMPARSEGSPLEVSETGAESITVSGVRVGEVWLAGGQSNMAWTVEQCRPEDQAIAREGEVRQMSLFHIDRNLSTRPLDDVDASWQPATPNRVMKFSAVGYFFGRRLAEELDVPVGIISSSWGGSRIEPWTPLSGFEAVEELAGLHRERLPRTPGTEPYREAFGDYLDTTRDWLERASAALESGDAIPDQPTAPPSLEVGHAAETGTYQAMIHPLKPYGLRGFLWYQGESNLADGMAYRWKMEALIRGWRDTFDAPEAPFLFVQLAPYRYDGQPEDALPRLWTAQQRALEIPHTGMAVINDIGNPRDIHPRNKSEVGHRLAGLALKQSYGRDDLGAASPLFEMATQKDGALFARFRHVGEGLETRDGGALDSFEIAGEDGVFHPARAEVVNTTDVRLTSPEVPRPVQARFAWTDTASPDLVNSAGLPAAAFHTHWPDDPELGSNVALDKPHHTTHPNSHGWNAGLTDGRWDGEAGQCFATDARPGFPKHATVDLGAEETVHAIRIGTPAYGSTKTLSVSISTDGDSFETLGRSESEAGAEERHTYTFDPRPARYVRVSFLDQHPRQDHYDRHFAFLRELEVYAPTD